MMRRGLLIGGLGMSLTLAGAGVITAGPALAQDSSSSPATETTREERQAEFEARRAELEAERQEQYDNFLAKFAEHLGVEDPALVETAFKETLKEMIDEELAAGDISANAAAEMKTRIDEAEGPILFAGFGGGGEARRGGLFRDRHFHGGRMGPGGDGPGRHKVIIRGDGGMDEIFIEEAGEVESLPATEEGEATPAN